MTDLATFWIWIWKQIISSYQIKDKAKEDKQKKYLYTDISNLGYL